MIMKRFQVIVSEIKKTIHIIDADFKEEAWVEATKRHNDGKGVSMGVSITTNTVTVVHFIDDEKKAIPKQKELNDGDQ